LVKLRNIEYLAFYMDFLTINSVPIVDETKFRTPLHLEQQVGLWVDRMGYTRENQYSATRLRKLGQYAVVSIEAGTGYFLSGTTGQVKVASGDVIVLFPDEPNTYWPQKRWNEKFIVFNGPDAGKLEKLGFLSRENMIIKGSYRVVSATFELLSKIINKEDTASILERRNIISNMILQLFKLTKNNQQMNSGNELMERVVEFLRKNYDKEFSVPALAEMFNLSDSHFRRLFKKHTGRSPRQFITSLRMSTAKELLIQNKAVKEVAREVGYKDIFYFMRVFKETTGSSAGEFKST